MTYFLLTVFYPFFLTTLIVCIFFIFILTLPKLLKGMHTIPHVYKFFLLGILIVGFLLRFYTVPNFHRIYFDEDRYLSYAVTFAKFNKMLSIDVATQKELVMGNPDTAGRSTVPVIHGLVLKIFGFSEYNLFQTAKIFSILQVLLVFILMYLLFKNYLAATLSAAGMAFAPTNIYWSSSLNLDTYAVFFALFALIGAVWYAKEESIKSTLFTIFSFFLLLGVRIESFVFLIVIVFTIFAVRKDENKKLFHKVDFFFYITLFLFVTLRALLSFSVLGQKWCCAEALPLEVFAPAYFVRNLLPNISHLFMRLEFPFIVTVLALITIFSGTGLRRIAIGLWVIIYFVLYSLYYAGNFFSYEFSGSYGRYFLMLIPGIVMLASLSFGRIIHNLKKKKIYLFLFTFLFLLCFLPTALQYKTLISSSPYFRVVEEGPKILHDFLEYGIIKNTKKDEIIIHTLTGFALLNGRDAIFIGYFFDKEEVIKYVEDELKNGKKIYVFETYTCDIFPKRCKKIKSKFKFTRLNLKEGRDFGLDVSEVRLK